MIHRICYLIDDDPDEQDIFDMALAELDNGIQLIYEVDSRMAVKKLRRGEFYSGLYFYRYQHAPVEWMGMRRRNP